MSTARTRRWSPAALISSIAGSTSTKAERTRMPRSGKRRRSAIAASMPSVVCVGGIRTFEMVGITVRAPANGLELAPSQGHAVLVTRADADRLNDLLEECDLGSLGSA